MDTLAYDGWLKIFLRQFNRKTYEILKDRNAVSAAVVNANGDMLLVRQFRPALMRDTLEIPAGTMDQESENEVQCLLRELSEETGLDVGPETVKPAVTYIPNIGFSGSLMRMYYIKLPHSGPDKWNVGDCDVSEARWLGLAELGGRLAAGDILDVKTLIAYLYIKDMEKSQGGLRGEI